MITLKNFRLFGGTPLALNGMKYYWRIKLWDDDDNEGAWTNGKDYFIMQGKRIQDLAYTYDNVGNIMQIIDESETNAKKKLVFEYDDLYRLTSSTISDSYDDYTQTYTYDSLGNFLTKSDLGTYEYEGNTGTSFANPHAVTTINSAAEMDYDNNGNATNLHISSFVVIGADYDYNNRIIETLRPNSQTQTYKYDHVGQRVEQNISSGDKITVYPNKYYEETTEDSNTTETMNIYAHEQLIGTAQSDGSSLSLYFVHPDHLNSSSVMTNLDSTGSIDQVIDYTPFGSIRFNEQNSSHDFDHKFTGHIADDSTTLQYFGARYYQGDVGRFWTEDPAFLAAKFDLSNPQTLNAYSYVKNNPMRYFDPLGLFEVESGKIEKGDTLSSIAPQINKQYGTNLSVKQIAQANNIKDPNKIKTGDYLAIPNKTNLELRFDNKNLQAYDTKYNIPYDDLKWQGVSGGTILKFSPIPNGKWEADPANTQNYNDLSGFQKFLGGIHRGLWPGGESSWGSVRTELNNIDTGQKNTGYYIHGGDTPGSKGCIDLTGDNNSFQDWFNNTWNNKINVIVNH